MDKLQPPLTGKEIKDLKVLASFTSVYCRQHHAGPREVLQTGNPGLLLGRYPVCPECRDFLDYAIERRLRCPLEPKPICKHCTVHCYRPGHREKVREIMRFSGKYLLKRGRLDLLWHYFF
ncbi:MAG: nitrous oxide-stimulated promoter family protein [Desulfuromonas sp.]|nr:MAG: nitrous oxide-stimulated promoter family protein [Desulfuromonas sp.]